MLPKGTKDMFKIGSVIFHTPFQTLAVDLVCKHITGTRNQHIDFFLGGALQHEIGIIQADHQARQIV